MMADFINTIDLLGDENTAKSIIEKSITEYNDNVINLITEYAFTKCSALTSVDLPNLTNVGSGAFYECTALTSIYLPSATSLANNAFSGCAALTSIDLPNATSFAGSAFRNCSALKTLVLRASTLCTLGASNVFEGTPLASNGTGGTVYVPSALISQYQNATNWSTLYAGGKCNFVAIEGSEYE